MTAQVTAERAQALRNAASKGPWAARKHYVWDGSDYGIDGPEGPVAYWEEARCYDSGSSFYGIAEGDARLIAAAPDLADEVVALSAEVERLRQCFERAYAARSNMTVERLHELGQRAERCDCDEQKCTGWQMASRIVPDGPT